MDTTGEKLFAWQEKYACGVVAVDTQHQFIFELARTAHQAMLAGERRERILAHVEDLHAAMESHFRNEENVMADRRYDQFAQHRREHAGFLEQLTMARNRLQAGHDELTPSVLRAVDDWITTHVCHADAALCAFLRQSGKIGGC